MRMQKQKQMARASPNKLFRFLLFLPFFFLMGFPKFIQLASLETLQATGPFLFLLCLIGVEGNPKSYGIYHTGTGRSICLHLL